MAVLFAGGEDTAFTGVPNYPVSTNFTGYFRSQFARCAISALSANTGSSDPPVNRFQTPTFTPSNLVWVHAQIHDGLSGTVLNQQGLIVRSPDGVSRILIRQTATPGTLKFSTRNAAGTITDIGSPFTTGAVSGFTAPLDIKIDYSSTGGCQVWYNGVSVFSYTGDPRTDSATTLNQVEFAYLFTTNATFYSEIIVADQDTRGMGLWTLAPNAAGNTQSWLPNTAGNINETTISDATAISTPTNDALSEWTITGSAPTGTYNVLALVQDARLQCGTTGPQAFDWVVRTAGTDYVASDSHALTTSYTNYSNRQWPLNPNTGSAWLLSQITTAGFNFGIKALATVGGGGGGGAPGLDGYTTGTSSGTTTVSATLTTTHANDIVCALVYVENSGSGNTHWVTGMTGGSLTWQKRTQATSFYGGTTGANPAYAQHQPQTLELWWALAPTALTGVTITATVSSAYDSAALLVFGVSGCNTTNPWDSNVSLAARQVYFGATSSAPNFPNISTTQANDFLIFGYGSNANQTIGTVPTGFTAIGSVVNTSGGAYASIGAAYKAVTAATTNQTYTWGSVFALATTAAVFDVLTADTGGSVTGPRPAWEVLTRGIGTTSIALYTAGISANNVLVLVVYCQNNGAAAPAVTSVSGGSLTWTQKSRSHGSASGSLEIWFAPVTGTLGATAITVTLPSNDGACAFLMSVAGCATAMWDSNASLPKLLSNTTGTSSWTPSITGLSTSQAHDLVIAVAGVSNDASGTLSTVPSGFSFLDQIWDGVTLWSDVAVGIQPRATTQSGVTVTWGAALADAVTTHTGGEYVIDALTADTGGIAGLSASDAYFSNVMLLVHADGTAGSTTFIDSSSFARTLTASGAGTVISSAAPKFGTGAIASPGSLSIIDTGNSADFNLGSGQFTIEAWGYWTSTPSLNALVSQWDSSTNNGWWFGWTAATTLTFLYSTTGTDSPAISGVCSPALNTWIHFAVDRDAANTVRVYVDGTVIVSTMSVPAIYASTRNCRIANDHIGSRGFIGYLDEVRVTRGIARYGGPFVPPTAAFPNATLVATTTWDPAYKDTLQTLSGSNLVATSSAGSGTVNSAVYATRPISPTAKVYFEVTITGTAGQYLSIGIINGSASLTTNIGSVNGAAMVNKVASGQTSTLKNGVGSGGTFYNVNYASGQVIQVAVDRAANRMWWRTDLIVWSSGNTWYGAGFIPTDPAAGTNGIDISVVTGTIYPAISSAWTGDVCTFNGGTAPFVYGPPPGFLGMDFV